jgi:hypothetical protein
LLSFSVCNIFVAWYFVCSAWFCAATISLSVSAYYYFFCLCICGYIDN